MNGSVLIVEDVPETRTMLRVLLELFEFEVFEARDGLDALQKMARALPDVVVMDVMMPRMDGITACKKLRQEPKFAHLPVIMLSGKAHKHAVDEGMAAGANLYLSKPVDSNQLVGYIRSLMAVTAPMPMPTPALSV